MLGSSSWIPCAAQGVKGFDDDDDDDDEEEEEEEELKSCCVIDTAIL